MPVPAICMAGPYFWPNCDTESSTLAFIASSFPMNVSAPADACPCSFFPRASTASAVIGDVLRFVLGAL